MATTTAPPRSKTRASRRTKPRPAKPELWPSLGNIAERWISTKCIYGEGDYFGQLFKLTAGQRLFAYRWFEYKPGTLDEDSTEWVRAVLAGEIPSIHLNPKPPEWRYSEAIIFEPKGEGKTQWCAALGEVEYCGPPVIARQSPNVVMAAASYEQTAELFAAAQTMSGGQAGAEVEEAPLGGLFKVFEKEILFADGRPGRMWRGAAVSGTKDGGKPTLFIADEIHEWKAEKARQHTVVANSIIKRRNCRVISLSTVGKGKYSTPSRDTDPLWWKMYVQALDAIAHPERHPKLLAVVSQAPEGLDPNDRADVEKGIRAASSAADVFWSVQDRVDRFFDPKVPKHECIRYFWNVPTEADEDSWLDEHPGAWSACEGEEEIPAGAPVGVAVDMALRHDSAAVVWGHLLPDGRTVVRSEVSFAKGGKIDYPAMVKFLSVDLPARHRVEWIAYDPRFFELIAQTLEDEGFLMVEFPQSPERMGPACGHALQEIIDARVVHEGDPTLAAHVNAGARREGERGFTLSKGRSRGHIDACVALVMMLWTMADPPVVEDSTSVYEERGLVTL